MLRRSKTLSMAHFFNRLLLNWLRRKRFFPFRYIKGWSCNVDQVSFGLFWACCGKVIARLRSVFPVFVRQINFSEFCLLSCEFADQIRTDESTHCSVVKLIFFGKFLSRHWSSPPVSDMAKSNSRTFQSLHILYCWFKANSDPDLFTQFQNTTVAEYTFLEK